MKTVMLITLLVVPLISIAQTIWRIELNGGLPYNIPMPLIIKQHGQPAINIWARYYSEPFTLPVYWDIKISRQKGTVAYELELMHHKLYLQNKPDGVRHFGISHGFNLLFLNQSQEREHFTLRYGGGIIIAHPESEIRGKKFGDAVDPYDLGYYLTGPVAQLAIGKSFRAIQRIRLHSEVKLLAAYSHTPIAEGKAYTWYAGFHLLFGIQLDLKKHAIPVANNTEKP